jgi:CBS domain-containing protein
MTERRVRHIPVLEGDKAVGMISIGDVVAALAESYKVHEKHMKDFIAGGY